MHLLFAWAFEGTHAQNLEEQEKIRDDILPRPEGEPQPWDNDAGDFVAQFAGQVLGRVLGVAMTLLGQELPYHLGLPEIQPTRYVVYDERRQTYLAAKAARVLRADELYMTPSMAEALAPADRQTLRENAEIYSVVFHASRAEFLNLPAPARASDRARAGQEAMRTFYFATDQPLTPAMVNLLGESYAELDNVVTDLKRLYPAYSPHRLPRPPTGRASASGRRRGPTLTAVAEEEESTGKPDDGLGLEFAESEGSEGEDQEFAESEGSEGQAEGVAPDSEEWQRANPWWSMESDNRTREGPYSPSREQRLYLTQHWLQLRRWIKADGDCVFNAVVDTAGQDEIRRLIRVAAQRSGIQVPPRVLDDIRWLLAQAAGLAGAALPEVGPDDSVTGQHLRLFLAHLLEIDRDGWRSELFAPDDTPASADPRELTLTRRGLVAALRRLTTFDEPYATHFPELITSFLGISLQFLQEDGSRAVPHGDGSLKRVQLEDEETARYTIVLREEHYLATRQPTPEQRIYLTDHGLQAWWVDADWSDLFNAAAETAGPDVRGLIRVAAQRSGIQVPPDVLDDIRWLLGQAADLAGVVLPEFGPDDAVTGQHLRLFLAHLLEIGRDGWRAEPFAPHGTPATIVSGQYVVNGQDMIAALRRLADEGQPYDHLFPGLITRFLRNPLQFLREDGSLAVLHPDGSLRILREDDGSALYTIVPRERRYLATRRRIEPDDPGSAGARPEHGGPSQGPRAPSPATAPTEGSTDPPAQHAPAAQGPAAQGADGVLRGGSLTRANRMWLFLSSSRASTWTDWTGRAWKLMRRWPARRPGANRLVSFQHAPVPRPGAQAPIAAIRGENKSVYLAAGSGLNPQQFATRHGLTTWATPGQMWVSPTAVFIGQATLSTDPITGARRLRPIADGVLHRYDPGGHGPVTNPGLPPVRVLTAREAAAHPATDWEARYALLMDPGQAQFPPGTRLQVTGRLGELRPTDAGLARPGAARGAPPGRGNPHFRRQQELAGLLGLQWPQLGPAQQSRDGVMLSAITVPPAARKEVLPSAALNPVPAAGPGQPPAGFIPRLPGERQGFNDSQPPRR